MREETQHAVVGELSRSAILCYIGLAGFAALAIAQPVALPSGPQLLIDDYIIERAGKPLVAVVSMEKYALLETQRQAAFGALEKIWKKMEGEDSKEVEKTIREAIIAVRNK